MIPGKIENWITIFDMKGVGLTQIPKKTMKAMAKPMQEYFKGRLYKLYIVNAQWTIKLLLKLAKKLVDPLTMQKFVVCGEKPQEDLG